MKTTSNFLELLKQFCEEKRRIVILNPAAGGIDGIIIKVEFDFIQVKVIDKDTNMFYNVFVPLTSIYGIQIEDGSYEG